MGCWGMGITQSDEFCDIYDKFMKSYDSGSDPKDITASILEEYRAEFEEDDGVMHDVYFAIAKAEGMCCAQSDFVLERVKKIIEITKSGNWEKVKNLNYVIYTYNLLIGDEYDDSFSFIISEYSSEENLIKLKNAIDLEYFLKKF